MARTKTLKRKLTPDEFRKAARLYMASAQAHQRAAVLCRNHPDAQSLKNPDVTSPDINLWFFLSVAFEMILLSVEQSLRLLLLLRYSIVRDATNHDSHALYNTIRSQSDGTSTAIIEKANEIGRANNLAGLTENDVVTCLKRHMASYNNVRYLGLDRQGRLKPRPIEISRRDQQILHCLALALIHLNGDEMQRRDVSTFGSTARLVPDSEMTDDERAIKERLLR